MAMLIDKNVSFAHIDMLFPHGMKFTYEIPVNDFFYIVISGNDTIKDSDGNARAKLAIYNKGVDKPNGLNAEIIYTFIINDQHTTEDAYTRAEEFLNDKMDIIIDQLSHSDLNEELIERFNRMRLMMLTAADPRFNAKELSSILESIVVRFRNHPDTKITIE